MRGFRVALAFLITPLITIIAGLLLYVAHTGVLPSVFAVWSVFRYSSFIAYIVTAILGVPAYLILRSTRFGGRLMASVYGGIIGLAISCILFALVPGFFIRDNIEGYIVYTLTGAVSGLVFWIIASGRKVDGATALVDPNGEI